MGLTPDRPLARPVVVRIEALELQGFPAARQHAVALAFERELGRLFRTRGVPAALEAGRAPAQHPGAPPTPAVRVNPRGPAVVAGRAIARAVYRSLG